MVIMYLYIFMTISDVFSGLIREKNIKIFLNKMTMRKTSSIVVIVILLLVSFSGLFTGCVSRESLVYDGQKRTYVIHLPASYNSSESYPLVLVLHGGGGNAANAERMTGFSKKADEEGFIVVYPEGSGRFKRILLTWNGGFCCEYALDHNIDDVGFIRALIEEMNNMYSINTSMIYITGMSNGAIMAYRLGAELSDLVAAVGPVAGSIGGKATEDSPLWVIPDPEYPLSVISFNGVLDHRVPYDGGCPTANYTKGAYCYMSVNESIAFWVYHDNCSQIPDINVSESGNIIVTSYMNGENGTEVVLYTIVNGGHAWPGGEKGTRRGDEPTQEISATDILWEFFKTHPKQ
jgi:polyhydroxybutyrate depolymerase